jgi:glutathione synthase/RimK-type ligase-like ATP-grasp enzyme
VRQRAGRVLILAPAEDFHALAVRALLEQRGIEVLILDVSSLPASRRMAHRVSHSGCVLSIDGDGLDDLRSVWWRRISAPDVSEVRDPEERRFAQRETREAFIGALLATGAPIVNDPIAERAASRKPYQLHVARSVGLDVPRTTITNDEAQAREFLREMGEEEVVFKALTATPIGMTDTRPFTPDHKSELWRLRYAPMILQQFVPLGRDLRVTMVGDRTFAAELSSRKPAARYDWRIDLGYEVEAVTLEAVLEDKLQALRRALGLATGSADLRVSPHGVPYFLEINPAGQFAFLEAYAGIPVLEAFADFLAEPEEVRSSLEVAPA